MGVGANGGSPSVRAHDNSEGRKRWTGGRFGSLDSARDKLRGERRFAVLGLTIFQKEMDPPSLLLSYGGQAKKTDDRGKKP